MRNFQLVTTKWNNGVSKLIWRSSEKRDRVSHQVNNYSKYQYTYRYMQPSLALHFNKLFYARCKEGFLGSTGDTFATCTDTVWKQTGSCGEWLMSGW